MVFLRLLWRKWLPITQAIGNFQAQVILSLFYFSLFLPVAIFFRFFQDPLRLKAQSKSNFENWQYPKETLEEARKPY